MQGAHRGDGSLVNALNRLKEELSESNNVNIGNLTALNNNIELLFAYFRDAFLAMANEKEVLQRRLAFAQEMLKKNNLAHLLDEEQTYPQFHCTLDSINQQMRTAVQRRIDLESINCDTRSVSQRTSKSSRSTPSNKQQTSAEYSRATAFVREQLVERLEEEESRTVELPKNGILNLYLQWRERQHQPVDYQFLSSVQMALTNEIKRHFPASSHNSRSFRGIQFKPQFRSLLKDLLKTDVKVRECSGEGESQEESPQLPTFADDHLAV